MTGAELREIILPGRETARAREEEGRPQVSDLSMLEQLEALRNQHLNAALEHQAAAKQTEKAIDAVQALQDIAPAQIRAHMAHTRRAPKAPPKKRGVGPRNATNGDGVTEQWAKGRRLWDDGKDVKEIAAALGVSTFSVYNHRKSDGWPARSE
jgi:DNA-binding NarL/FixJ family response regulator